MPCLLTPIPTRGRRPFKDSKSEENTTNAHVIAALMWDVYILRSAYWYATTAGRLFTRDHRQDITYVDGDGPCEHKLAKAPLMQWHALCNRKNLGRISCSCFVPSPSWLGPSRHSKQQPPIRIMKKHPFCSTIVILMDSENHSGNRLRRGTFMWKSFSSAVQMDSRSYLWPAEIPFSHTSRLGIKQQ